MRAEREERVVQLATRIPKSLHRRLKLYCVESGVSVMAFVTAAIAERLRTKRGEPKARK